MRFSIVENAPALPGSFRVEVIAGRCVHVLRFQCVADSPQPDTFRHWTLEIEPSELVEWVRDALAFYIVGVVDGVRGKAG